MSAAIRTAELISHKKGNNGSVGTAVVRFHATATPSAAATMQPQDPSTLVLDWSQEEKVYCISTVGKVPIMHFATQPRFGRQGEGQECKVFEATQLSARLRDRGLLSGSSEQKATLLDAFVHTLFVGLSSGSGFDFDASDVLGGECFQMYHDSEKR
jgi:hypothetical protein